MARPRVRIVAGALALVGIVAVAVGSGGAIAAADGASMPKGGATAVADTSTINLSSAGIEMGFTFGRSTAQYKDTNGTGEGRALDLGLLNTLLAQPQCNGKYPAILNTATLPPKSVADSSVEGSEQSRKATVNVPSVGTDPAGPPIGVQDATATALPSAHAETAVNDTDFGLLGLFGASTYADTRLEGGVRYAHAVSSARQLTVLGGILTFENPRWEATARSGGATELNATFDFSSASLLGMPRSHDQAMGDLQGFKGLIENVLAGLGVHLQLPTVEKGADGMSVSISPMGLVIDHPPIGTDLIFPFLNSDMMREQAKRSVEEDCRNATAWTVISVLKGVFGGTGSIKLVVGGASAATDATDYSVAAFGDPTPATEAPATTEPPTTDTTPTDPGSSSYDTTTGGDLGTSDFTTTGDLAMEDTTLDTTAEDLGTTEEVAAAGDSTAAGAEKSKKIGATKAASESDAAGNAAAVLLGSLALLGAVGLSLGDRFLARRNRRLIP